MAAHNDFGEWGELVARDFLKQNGYFVICLDWKNKHRDLDIVAIDNTTQEIVFVEVKTRRNTLFGEPEDSVDHQKKINLKKAASAYLHINKTTRNYRFDIITVVGVCDEDVQIKHIKNAIY